MIQYVQDNLPENISSALGWTVILIIVGFGSFLGAKQTQKKVYSLVWEDAYYSMQAERTKKNKANGKKERKKQKESEKHWNNNHTQSRKPRSRTPGVCIAKEAMLDGI